MFVWFFNQDCSLRAFEGGPSQRRFWIKVDAGDLKAALQESTSGIWNGDVDMVDGKVAALHKEYMDRKALMNGTIDQLQQNVVKIVDFLKQDITFLASGLEKLKEIISKNLTAPQHHSRS